MKKSTEEVWAPLKTKPSGVYHISNWGNIWSNELGRCITNYTDTGTGYVTAWLNIPDPTPAAKKNRMNLSRSRVVVARLVALTFCSRGKNSKYVTYKDGDKTNIHADNLQWITASQLMKGLPRREGVKLTAAQVKQLRHDGDLLRLGRHEKYKTIKQLAKAYSLSEMSVFRTLNGTSWPNAEGPIKEKQDLNLLTRSQQATLKKLVAAGYQPLEISHEIGITYHRAWRIVKKNYYNVNQQA